MADISQVKLPNGDTYNLVDETSGYITTSIYSGTCASAAADTTKVVTCADFTELKAGAAILVTFSATNSAAVADLMMNVNDTGAKKIQYINNGTRGNLSSAGYLKASTTYLFVYDGTYWVVYLNYNTTYSSMTDAEITAGTGTTARTITPARLKTAVETWAPEETDPVFSASAAAGITSTDISNWNNKTSNTGTITSVKTTAGVHTTINVSSGAVNFNVPTHTSHLTNDSGFITSDSDEKVESITVTAETTMYLTGSTSNTTNTAGLSKHESIKAVVSADTNYNGVAALYLGNNKMNSVTSGAKKGQIYLYGQSTGYLLLQATVGGTSQTITFPNNTGTVALTSDIPSVYSSTNTGGYLTMATLPIYDGTVV